MGQNQQSQGFSQSISAFFDFINGKLNDFPNLTRGEQISFISIGVGLILILTSMVLFIL